MSSLHVTRVGLKRERPTLVFLHYFAGSSREWTGVMNVLGDQYAYIALDLPGFGSSPPLSHLYSVANMADAVVDALVDSGIASYVIVAHSMSAKIAWVIAARQVAGLDALILVAPSPPQPEPIAESERMRLQSGFGNRAEAERTACNLVASALFADEHERVVDDALCTARVAWDWWLQQGSLEDLTNDMPHISTPTLVLAGEHDEPLSPAFVQQAVTPRIHRVKFDVIPGVKHLIPVEAPVQLAMRISAFCAHPGA